MGAWLLLISRENSTRLPSAGYNTRRGAVCGFWFCSGDSNMSQAQVTEFFCQRKSGAARAPGHRRKGRVRGSSASGFHHGNKESALCCSPVREEFVRVVDEAAGLSNDRQSASSRPDTDPASPRTPKRSSAEAEFDLGAAVFSAAAEHSSVKRRRQAGRARDAEANTTEKTTRGTARKKLVLPEDTTQAFCKDDITALRSRLQKIRQQAENIATSTSPAASSHAAGAPPTSGPRDQPESGTTAVLSSGTRASSFTVARARELAAKAQRRKEEREAGEVKLSQAPPPALAPPPAPDGGAEQPAYQRYHTLAQATPPGLSLPYQYKILAEMFRSMDTVVAMLYNRSETATFAKIKQGVQDMMHRRFEESHVGQIKTVFPAAFSFRQQKNIPTFNSNVSRGSYQLTVEPVLSSDRNEARPVLSASRLLERRRVFHQNLISVVKQHHKAFLSSLVPPVSVPEDKLTRWHPRFNVDAVPAVQVGSLPPPPHTENVSTAQEVLEKARSLITPKMEKALVSLTQNAGDADGTKPVGSQNPAAAQPAVPPAGLVPSSLKGVSQSLLDRIRAKEAQKLQAAMTRNPAQEERLLMLTRLGELARILRNVFVAEKKSALVMEVACNRMAASYRSALSLGEMEKHIRLLAEVAPDWLSIHPIRKDFYLKLNKMVELNVILDKLNHRLREEERL
ncbi:DNA replication factor Cdt1 [Xiphophorus couchianus]|uniref:DNA replication factor Cdt1 n=1 Tax=Xiphophorus couchianus TaxID=32473 RepID=UPI0010166268|nr:DNA replication factor Cdt1 [Xiphophorus couchianus]